MPTQKETPRQLLGHCPSATCRGSAQKAVQGIEVLTEWTYRENGGSSSVPGVEKSTITFRFPDDASDEATRCKSCGKHLELSDQPKPKYEPLSGHPADGLLQVSQWGPGAGRSAGVEAMVDALAAKLDG